MAAFPLPPSIAHWDGLILGPRGVYETHINFGDLSGDADANRTIVSMADLRSPANAQTPAADLSRAQQLPPIEYSYFPDAPVESVHRGREASAASRNIFLVRAISRHALSQGRIRFSRGVLRCALPASRPWRVAVYVPGPLRRQRRSAVSRLEKVIARSTRSDEQRLTSSSGASASRSLSRMNHHLPLFAHADALGPHARHLFQRHMHNPPLAR